MLDRAAIALLKPMLDGMARGLVHAGIGADAITLADVYFAVEDENVFRMHKADPNSHCPVAAQLGKVLNAPLRAAECALHTSLARTTLSDVATAIV